MMLPVIQLIIIAAFILFIVARVGVLQSISDSYYHLGKLNWLFTIVLFIIGFTTCLYGSALFFLSGASFCFCGAAAAFKEQMTKTVHYVGAGGGVLFALLALGLNGVWFPAAGFILSIFLLYKVSHRIWWIEIAAIVLIECGIILKLWS